MNENIHTAEMKENEEYTLKGRVDVIDSLFPEIHQFLIRVVVFDGKESIFVNFRENGPVSMEEVAKLKVDDEIMVKGICLFDNGEAILDAKEIVSISHPGCENKKIEEHRIELNLHTRNSQTACFSSFFDYAKKAKELGMDTIAITDIGSTQSYYDAYLAGKELGLKILYGLETEFIDEERNIIVPIVVYAKNRKGLTYIYQLVTMQKTHITFGNDGSIINKALLNRMKDGLFLAFSPNNIDLTTYLSNDLDAEKLLSRFDFYDFIEIAPLSTYLPFTRPSLVNEYTDPKIQYKELLNLIYRNKKTIAIVSNAHYLSQKQKEYASVFDFGADNPSYVFLSTDELLQEYQFLNDPKMISEIILRNPKMIADKIESLSPFDDSRKEANDKDAMSRIEDEAYEAGRTLYGDPLPDDIRERLDSELDYIEKNKLAPYFDFAAQLSKSWDDNHESVNLNGILSSSFVAYLLSLTDTNPLYPNYFCQHCQNSIPLKEPYSLEAEDKACDLCQNPFRKEGFVNYPELLFLEPDPSFDFEVSIAKDDTNMEKLKEILAEKKNKCYKRSKILGIEKEEADERIKQYYKQKDLGIVKQSDLRRLDYGLVGVHDSDDEISSDVMIVPDNIDMNKLSPMEYTPSTHFPWMMTHMDYSAFEKNFRIFSIHGSQRLYDLSQMNRKADITSLDLNLKTEDSVSGLISLIFKENQTLGLPYIDSELFDSMDFSSLSPDFSTLTKLVSISFRKENEASILLREIKENPECLSSLPTTYEDLYELLLSHQADKSFAYELISDIRKGGVNGLDRYLKYIDALKKLSLSDTDIHAILLSSHLADRGECVTKAMRVLNYAYYKSNYPGLFYSTILEKYVFSYDTDAMLQGKDSVKEKIAFYTKHINEISKHAYSLIHGLRITLECLERGYSFRNENMDNDHFGYDEETKTITLSSRAMLMNNKDTFTTEEEDINHA